MLCLASLAAVSVVSAQIIVDPMAPVSICGSPTLNIGYTVGSAFNVGNEFSVELSDALGSFASPTVIGSAASTGSGSISCSFPAGIQGGSGHAIRVVATDPAEIGDAYVLPISTVVPPNAGLNTAITLCSNSAPVLLTSLLGGSPDPDGTWSGPGAVGGIFDPSTDPPGIYQYVVEANAPCVQATAALSITVVIEPNAGTGGSLTVCSSDVPFIMFSELTGSPQQGGIWTGPNGAVMNGVFIPSTSPAGCYVYVVAGNLPCPNENAVLCISVNPMVELGPDFTLSVCGITPVDMQADLPAGGTWTYQGQPHSNMFTPGVDAPGLYRYTIPGVSPCTASMVDVTVVVVQPPNAGTNATLSHCLSQGDVDLFAQLGGTPALGGTWVDNIGTGQLVGGTFVVAGMPSGSYTFIYSVAGGNCPDAQAIVTVNLNSVCVMPPANPYPAE